ncbi:unnamed protein product [Somion occarium]|uniref:Phosphoinositide phospholipase C n=1 Tax=Somion occarium TaxID=3059160 RepID=A0ABP1DSB0_9APHY
MSKRQRPTSMMIPSSTEGRSPEYDMERGQGQQQQLPRRMLHRAANLLTTKGEPIPAIVETILELESQQSASDSSTSRSDTNSNSKCNDKYDGAGFKSSPGALLTRRRSESSAAALSFGGIRRKLEKVKDVSVEKVKDLKDASASVVRTKSFSRRRLSTTDKSSSFESSPPAINSNSGDCNNVHHSGPSQRRRSHIRSYSDVLFTRPRFFQSEPAIVHEDKAPSINCRVLTLPVVHSPDPIDDYHRFDSPISPPSTARFKMGDFAVPPLLKQGVPMMKVSAKKQKRYIFRLDPDQGHIVWESKKLRIIPIENIKELRSGVDARYYREQFQLAQEYEDRWLTIIYVMDGGYKTLHLIAATKDIFQMWDVTLRKLHDIRQQLMSGLGNIEMRQAVWEKQFWTGADEEADQKLDFDDVERMCRRLNINPSREDLLRRFKQADIQNRGYLDFTDFRRFVKSLKARSELDRLYKKLANDFGGTLNYAAFERFMRHYQKSSLSESELQRIFVRYAVAPTGEKNVFSPSSSPLQNPMDLAAHAGIASPLSSPPLPPAPVPPIAQISSSITSDGLLAPPTSSSPPPPTDTSKAPETPVTWETGIMTLKGLTSFLLSTENAAFADQHGKVFHDMTRPLPEYFISSSHNTYLVGHQLVGDSTVEGYIRALLHSCRSVELDIYDGDKEPVIYHGRTLTTKVSLRDACQAIAKYAFVASPYPIIISAEVHCGIAQQAMIADIMTEVFGDALVRAPVDGRPKIEVLPSPEDLKGRVLLKAKNLYVSEKEGMQEKEVVVDTESSSTETSASDTDVKEEVKQEWRKARENEAEVIKDLKSKARNALGRVSNVATPRRNSSSKSLVALLVYTVGVKCRGLNKKEEYAPEHVFSLSETTANRILKQSMMDLIKHNRTHLVRVYPKGTRIGSTNYEPHRYWSAGCQLVAINWQTFDLGYMINHAMFQRNGRAGYVLKPLALRTTDKQLLSKRTKHFLDVKIISAQQLPRPKDSLGREVIDKNILDPFVEVSIHIPDWTHSPFLPPDTADDHRVYSPPTGPSMVSATSARTITVKTGVVKNNGFNPVWEQGLSLPFDCVGDMMDLIFVRFAVKQEDKDDEEPLAVYCCSLGSLNHGYRHLPLHDTQLSQYLFSTLFVRIDIRDV